MQKKQNIFFVRGAKRRPHACEATALTIRLHASHGMATVKTPVIGLYRDNAIAIQDEVGDSNGGNV